jgi:SAM-dependent methyltransferase
MSSEINSKEYWDRRFQEDWEMKNGRQQTAVFYNLLISNIPQFVFEFIKRKSDSINDVGCALGEGTALLQKAFKTNSLVGTDFSETAIENAKKNFNHIQFEVQDVLTSKKKYDVIIASNIIEHFPKPFDVLQKVLSNSKQIAIVMIPFQEDKENMEKEHSQAFDFKDFKLLTNDFSLIYSKEINLIGTPDGEYWYGRQLLLIYGKRTLFPIENLTIDNYIMDKNDKALLNSTIEIESLKGKLRDRELLKTQIEGLKKDVMEKSSEIEGLEKDIVEKSSVIEGLEKDVMEKSSVIDRIHSSRLWHIISRYHTFLNHHPRIKRIIAQFRR